MNELKDSTEYAVSRRFIMMKNGKEKVLEVVFGLAHLFPDDKKTRFYVSGKLDGQRIEYEMMCALLPNSSLIKAIAPVNTLHLSDIDGVPISFKQDAIYFSGMIESSKKDASCLAAHLRIPEWIASQVINKVARKELSKDDFALYLETLKEKYKDEANVAKAIVSEYLVDEVIEKAVI